MRYSISDLDLEHVDVWLKTVLGKPYVGQMEITPSGKQKFLVKGDHGYTKIPSTPSTWAPIDVDAWPYPLPEPIIVQGSVSWESPPEPIVELEDSEPDGDAWPYPHIRLGRRERAPECVLEAEARVLRYYRTQVVMEHEPKHRECCWPSDWMIAAQVVEKQLKAAPSKRLHGMRDIDYADFDVDESDLRPLPARWLPTPRDVSDYEWKNGPGSWVKKREKQLFLDRSRRPVWSFAQIADFYRTPIQIVKEEYQKACEEVFKRAKA